MKRVPVLTPFDFTIDADYFEGTTTLRIEPRPDTGLRFGIERRYRPHEELEGYDNAIEDAYRALAWDRTCFVLGYTTKDRPCV